MLIGEFNHSIDTKGRVAVPSRFREDLGTSFFITKGLDGCLFVLSSKEWSLLEEKIKAMPISKARGLQRFFFSGACLAESDKQGRILIPSNLREYASLTKEVTFIGTGARAELWDTDKWNKMSSDLTQENIAAAMDMLEL